VVQSDRVGFLIARAGVDAVWGASFETPLRQAQRLLRTNGAIKFPLVLRRD
jgi:hypothetical protein